MFVAVLLLASASFMRLFDRIFLTPRMSNQLDRYRRFSVVRLNLFHKELYRTESQCIV